MILWFIPIIIFLGLATCYTDIKKGKIKNKHLLIAWIYTAIAYSILTYTTTEIGFWYFVELAIMSAICLIAGFAMWHVGIWTAGDAKLFFTYSLIVPLSVYKYGSVQYFNSFYIIINTFLLLTPFLFLIILLKTTLKQKIIFMKKAFDIRYILSVIVSVIAFSWVIEWVFKFLKLPVPPLAMVYAMFLAVILLESIKFFKTAYILAAVSIARIILDPRVYSLPFLIQLAWISFLFIFLRFFMIRLSFSLFTKEVNINSLQEGMVPAEVIYFESGTYKKERFMFFGWFQHLQWGMKRKYLLNPSEPLDDENITKLKELSNKFGFKNLRVQQTLPFAPFMFFGVLITILAQGSAFVAVKKLLF